MVGLVAQPNGNCCARKILAAPQRDSKEQKGRLQEEVEALGHKALFHPKLRCELDPIGPHWCQASGVQGNTTIARAHLKGYVRQFLSH